MNTHSARSRLDVEYRATHLNLITSECFFFQLFLYASLLEAKIAPSKVDDKRVRDFKCFLVFAFQLTIMSLKSKLVQILN